MQYSLPDFLNLGVARPAPRGATGLAPRLALVMPFTYGPAYPRRVVGFQPLLMNVFQLVVSPGQAGPAKRTVQFTPLLPNPWDYSQYG
jgi:hypothetical protein